MRRRSASFLAVVLLLLFPIGACALEAASPEEVGLSKERLARIGQALNRQIDERSFPGAVALVARKGRVELPVDCWGSIPCGRAFEISGGSRGAP